jgi:hypothetical protein
VRIPPTRGGSRGGALVVGWVVAITGLAACGDSAPVEVSVQSACDEANRGDQVIVEGFLRLPDEIAVADTAVIDLWSLNGATGDRLKVRFPVGEAANQMKRPPENFSVTSLRVVAADGTSQATIRDRVRLRGPLADEECLLQDPTVEILTG